MLFYELRRNFKKLSLMSAVILAEKTFLVCLTHSIKNVTFLLSLFSELPTRKHARTPARRSVSPSRCCSSEWWGMRSGGHSYNMAKSAHASGSTTDAGTCRFNAPRPCQADVCIGVHQSEARSLCWWNLAGGETVESGIGSSSLKHASLDNNAAISIFVQVPLSFGGFLLSVV